VAKERRERLRATTAAGEDDFISLSVVKRAEESQGPHPESRLVREEDELGEGDDGMRLGVIVSFHSYRSVRVRRVHQCTGENCAWEEITQSRGK
jgi:hypothetical protein